MIVKTEYRIAKDVTWVNGANVTGQETIKLTEAEKVFDLALGRIVPIKNAEPVSKVKPNKPQDTAK